MKLSEITKEITYYKLVTNEDLINMNELKGVLSSANDIVFENCVITPYL